MANLEARTSYPENKSCNMASAEIGMRGVLMFELECDCLQSCVVDPAISLKLTFVLLPGNDIEVHHGY